MSLKRKAASGSIWISLTRTGINVIDFAVYAYLARILSLEDFGLVGFCLLFVEFTNTIVTAGVNQNLVQRKAWSDAYASSTMSFVLSMSFVLAGCLIFIGAPIANYAYSEVAAYVVASLAPITIIMSLQVVVSGKLLRDFKNKQMGIGKLIATIISAAVIILLAESGYGLWSLVIGRLVNACLEFLLLSFIARMRFSLRFNKADNEELLRFCLPLLWAAILNFTNSKVSNIVTGLILGPASFALLATAKKAEQIINQVTLSSINSMVVPSFSRVKEGLNIGELYIKLVTLTACIVLPLFMGLAAISDPFVTIAFGDKFAQSATYMSISAFIMFPSVVAWFLPSLLISQAKTRDAFKLTVISVVSNVLVAVTMIWFGITIMLISLVVVNFLILPLRFKIVSKHIAISVRNLSESLLLPFTCALGMFFIIVTSKYFLYSYFSSSVFLLLALILIGVVSYPMLAFIFFNRSTRLQIKEISGILSKKK